jgi:hypothetical protein
LKYWNRVYGDNNIQETNQVTFLNAYFWTLTSSMTVQLDGSTVDHCLLQGDVRVALVCVSFVGHKGADRSAVRGRMVGRPSVAEGSRQVTITS